jgi:hypothetical protein
VDEQEVQVQELLKATDLDCQQGMFKLTMKSNAAACMVPLFYTNPLTRMWRLVITSRILVSIFPKYVKLTKLAMVQIINIMEDERCFSTLAFMKSKVHNKLITHLPIVVHMLAQQFYTLENFPYVEYIE